MHARNLQEVSTVLADQGIDLEIVLADAFPEVARQAGEELGLRYADSVEALIELGIDALFITTSTGTHPDVIRSGLKAKLPMFCEKPIASNVPESLDIIRDIEAAGGVVQIGHQRRFDVGYQEAKRRFDSGELGWIHSLKAVSGDAFPPRIVLRNLRRIIPGCLCP